MATVLFAQDGELTLSGSVDTYFQTNLTAPDDAGQTFGSSFANQTGFALGMANIIASYEGETTGFVADLAFGSRGVDAIALPNGANDFFVNQFSHVGLKADFALSDDFSLMVAAMNATDVNNNTTGDYAFGAQLGYSGQYLNFYYDSGVVLGLEIDYTGGFDLTDEFYLGINAAYQTNDDAGFYGAALYPQYSASDAFSVGLRGEMFGGHQKDVEDIPSVLGLTLTGSYSIENLTFKPEIRFLE